MVKREILKNKKAAFTIAEVLITLTIIGVIAALTIPNLMNKYEEHKTVTAVKTAHSILSDALKQATIEYGTPDMWKGGAENSYQDAEAISKILLTYLKTAKICGGNNNNKCFSPNCYKTLTGNQTAASCNISNTNTNNWYRFVLKNGTSIGIWGAGENSNTRYDNRGHIRIDINNVKGPNQFGKDTFNFKIMNNGTVLPHGANNEPFQQTCNNQSDSSGNNSQNGTACTGWIIYKGNMDYLHCTGLTWASKSCKEK